MRKITLAVLTLLAACNPGGNSNQPAETGQASFVLTEAANDELTQFEVDVSNISLTKLNGNTVSVVPRSTRIDFVELSSLGELIAGITLEAGIYTGLTMDLDFSNAQVLIAGQPQPAVVRNQFGSQITGIEPVKLEFVPGSRLVVGALRHNLFVLDLDLCQSVSIDSGANEVTFTPVLNAEVDPNNPKPIAAKGILQSVDFDELTFTIERRALDGSVMGTFTVQTGNSTVFQLDGQNGVGPTALGSLPGYIGQCLFVQGAMTTASSRLQAVAVETGSGVPGNGQDWVVGHVVARSGGAGADPTLSVMGRSINVTTGTRHFNTLHTVELSHANTKVLRRGFGNSLDADAVNIGQLVWVFGDIAGTTLDATTPDGVARLLPTAIFGIAAGAPINDTLTLDLVRFGWRDIAAFNFTVSGQSQADPDAYEVDVTGISTAGITSGSKLRVVGWVEGVGPGGDDATGISIVNRSTTARLMFIQWTPPRTTAISQNSPAEKVDLDVSTAFIRFVADGFGVVGLNNAPAPSIKQLLGVGVYRIVQHGAIEVNVSFDVFRESILQRAATAPVFRIGAFGTFDESTQEFSALTLTVILD